MRPPSLVPLSFLCLTATLAAACSFDANRLRATASHTRDAALESLLVSDTTTTTDLANNGGTTSTFDAVLEGSGGTAGQSGSGGSADGPVSADLVLARDLAMTNDGNLSTEIGPTPDLEPDMPSISDAPITGGALVDGGISATGGTDSPTGGTTATGGATNSGGMTSSGGAIDSGGISGSGGTTGSGGDTSSGGTSAAGGNSSLGGNTSSGGSPASGSTTGSGGDTSSGGTSAAGGNSSLGGNTSSGGSPSSGGTIGTVTTTCPGAVPPGIASAWCSCLAQGSTTISGFTYTNNIWGSGPGPQCIWATTTTQWGAAANHPNTLNIKSYPNVSVSPQKAIKAISIYTSIFDVTVPSSGSYATAYNLSVRGNGPGRVQINLWMNWNGNMSPTSVVYGDPVPAPDRSNLAVGGHSWNVYLPNANNSTATFVRTSDTNSGTLDILAVLRWLIANNTSYGVFTANWTLDQVQFGFDITSDGTSQAFVTNNFAVTSN